MRVFGSGRGYGGVFSAREGGFVEGFRVGKGLWRRLFGAGGRGGGEVVVA